MAEGIWTAAAGARAQFQKLDHISNNLANASTQGFKKDTPTFAEYLAVLERPQVPQEIPSGPIREKEFYPLEGRDQAYVILSGTHIDFKTGPLQVTHHPLDFSLEGPGFFEVETPHGIRLTRQGGFQLNAEGFLITREGHFVLRSDAPAVQDGVKREHSLDLPAPMRRIRFEEGLSAPLGVSDSGELFLGDDPLARLSVVEYSDLKAIRKQGSALFQNHDLQQKPILSKKTKVLQGVLEGSNVNPVEEISHLIQTHRLFDQNLKSLKTYGELMGKEVNEVGKW